MKPLSFCLFLPRCSSLFLGFDTYWKETILQKKKKVTQRS